MYGRVFFWQGRTRLTMRLGCDTPKRVSRKQFRSACLESGSRDRVAQRGRTAGSRGCSVFQSAELLRRRDLSQRAPIERRRQFESALHPRRIMQTTISGPGSHSIMTCKKTPLPHTSHVVNTFIDFGNIRLSVHFSPKFIGEIDFT